MSSALLLSESVLLAVKVVCGRHNLSWEEEMRYVSESLSLSSVSVGVVKGVLKKGVSKKGVLSSVLVNGKKVPLPFRGVVVESHCRALLKNHGLYTQCDKKVWESGEYCKGCASKLSKGVLLDRVEDRMSCGCMEFVSRSGDKVKGYMEVLNKLKVSKEDVMSALSRENVVLDEVHWEVSESGKGKGKGKSNSGESVSKKKGRPKKNKVEVELEGDVDVFESIVKEVQELEKDSGVDKESDSEKSVNIESDSEKSVNIESDSDKKPASKKRTQKDDAAKEAAKKEKEAAKEAAKKEKEAAKEAAKKEKEAAKEAAKKEKEAAKEAAKKAKEEEKKAKEASKKAKEASKKAKEASKEEKTEEECLEEVCLEEEDSDEEEEVFKFMHEGVTYLRSKTGVLYDYMKAQKEGDTVVVGRWNESEKRIELEKMEESEEEYDD
jgi:hypothetical protein